MDVHPHRNLNPNPNNPHSFQDTQRIASCSWPHITGERALESWPLYKCSYLIRSAGNRSSNTKKRKRQRRRAAWSRYEWHVETQLVQQIPCLICGNNAAYKKIKFAVDIRGTTPPPPLFIRIRIRACRGDHKVV